jgi:molybdopterin guanine dinucleotide-containing S/N-oxide reductase-like protein
MLKKENPNGGFPRPLTGEQTTIKSLALSGGYGGAPCSVDYKDGRIIRIRPLHFDEKYDPQEFNLWQIESRGKVFRPVLKSHPGPFSLAYKKRALSPNRIKYPLKRVDWDPHGARNTQNRGKSKYRRISWDEAAEIVAGEIKRVHQQYGPLAILAQIDGHGECKVVHTCHGQPLLLLDKMGGFTQQARNPDSWEGWFWGAKHVWGEGAIGIMAPAGNIVKDMTQNSRLVLFWGCDPETTPWGFNGQSATRLCFFWSEIGIKQVYICPDFNYGAAVHADKWIPVLPNTDAALQLAVIYVWLTEGTYDKEYVQTHTVGMDKVSDYVLGKEDGVAKTPAWASAKCGVPEWTIKALAREWAATATSIAHYYGGSYIRGPYSHEPARLECILLGMQGLGKPGVHQAQIALSGMPRPDAPQKVTLRVTEAAHMMRKTKEPIRLPLLHMRVQGGFLDAKQIIPKTMIEDAILNPPLHFVCNGAIEALVEDQFVKYQYPIPREQGGTEIHMIWTDSPCRSTCWNNTNRLIEAMRSPKIECIVAQHPWLENDCFIADIILPSNTTLEVDDIMPNSSVVGAVYFQSIALQNQAMHPVGESKSDYEVVQEISKKLGMFEKVTEGRTNSEWIKYFFEFFEMPKYLTWEKFQEKGYYVFPTAKDWEQDPVGLSQFYADPVKNPLPTPSGKLEFYSARLAQNFPDDRERPPIPKWIEKGVSHDERISSERAKMFPLLLMSNHGRWRTHAQCDDITWTREMRTCKVLGWDGYKYEPVWMNPQDAARRGIRDGDIVRVFNERGTVLAGARVWERIMPGAVSVDHGARVDWIDPGNLDRGGAINLISPRSTTSQNCVGQATSGFLVDVQKVTMADMESWQKQFPDAFRREYDPSAGLRFDAWVEEEK